MKRILTGIFLLMSVIGHAQTPDKAFTKNEVLKQKNNTVSKAEVIVDGKPYFKPFDTFDQTDVFIADSLTQDTSAVFGSRSSDMIVVTTKKAAIKEYQEKFSLISKDYKAYILRSVGNDSKFNYIVKGKKLPHDEHFITALYNIRKEEIHSVSVSSDKRKVTVIISIK